MAEQEALGLSRTDLQRQDLSVPGGEAVQSFVDIGPEAPLVKHAHPGEEIIYILEGPLEQPLLHSRQAPRRTGLTSRGAMPIGAGGVRDE